MFSIKNTPQQPSLIRYEKNQRAREKMKILMPAKYFDLMQYEASRGHEWQMDLKRHGRRMLANLPKDVRAALRALAHVESHGGDEAALQKHLKTVRLALERGAADGLLFRSAFSFNYDLFCYLRAIGRQSLAGASLLKMLYDKSIQLKSQAHPALLAAIFAQPWSFASLQRDDLLKMKPTTPLHLAVVSDDSALVETLLPMYPKSSSVRKVLFSLAVEYGRSNSLRILHRHQSGELLTQLDWIKYLYLASQAGHEDMVSILLAMKPINIFDIMSALTNPVAIAAQFGHIRVIDMLLSNGFELASYPLYRMQIASVGSDFSRYRSQLGLSKFFETGLYVAPHSEDSHVIEMAKRNRDFRLLCLHPAEAKIIFEQRNNDPTAPDITIEAAQKILYSQSPEIPKEERVSSLFNLCLNATGIGYLTLPPGFDVLKGNSYLRGKEPNWSRFEQDIQARSLMNLTPENPVLKTWQGTMHKAEHHRQLQKEGKSIRSGTPYNAHKVGEETALLRSYSLFKAERRCAELEEENTMLRAMTSKSETIPVCSSSELRQQEPSTSFQRSLAFFQKKAQESGVVSSETTTRLSVPNQGK